TENYTFGEPKFLAEPTEAVASTLCEPGVLALSCYVWNFIRQMKVARLYKQRFPKSLVVAGGPHIHNRPERFFTHSPLVDLLVHGEGESTFRAILLENLKELPDWSRIPGLSYPVGHCAMTTGTGVRVKADELITGVYASGDLDAPIALCRAKNLRFYAP